MRPPHDFEKNEDRELGVEALLSLFKMMKPGELLSYQRMSGAVGYDVTSQTPPLRKALEIASRDLKLNLRNEVNMGYRLVDDRISVHGEASRYMRKTYRANKRTQRVLDNVDYQNLSIHDRAVFHAKQAAVSTIGRVSHGNSINAAARKKEISLLDEERQRLARSLKPPKKKEDAPTS